VWSLIEIHWIDSYEQERFSKKKDYPVDCG
jgi:hypothetical protein